MRTDDIDLWGVFLLVIYDRRGYYAIRQYTRITVVGEESKTAEV